MDRTKCSLVLSLVISSISGGLSLGQEVVDQIYELQNFYDQASFDSPGRMGALSQTFTVGRSGLLSRVDLDLVRPHEFDDVLTVDIRRTADGVVDFLGTKRDDVTDFSDAGVLARHFVSSGDLPVGSGYPMVYEPSFTVSINLLGDGIWVEPGDVLAISLVAPTVKPEDSYWWRSTRPGAPTYSRGARVFGYLALGVIATTETSDLMFRTYVYVPEPTSCTTAAAGMLGLLFTRRSGRH